MHKWLKISGAGAAAGAVNGLLGAGGGMVLLPMLKGSLQEEDLFVSAPAVLLPVCLVSLLLGERNLEIEKALPYLLGSLLGGLAARKIRVSAKSLHRILGCLILLGGGRLLWS